MSISIRINQLHSDLDARMAALRADASAVARSRAVVEQALLSGDAHYGINTGFGALANKRISDDKLRQLQRNILLSHACGVGDPVPPFISRLMLKLKIHALGLGNSGISETTFAALLAIEEKGLVPWIPSRGSVGASGDLAPLAHMSLPLIGLGEFWSEAGGQPEAAATGLRRHQLETVELQPKDGLALINGTQLMLAYGADILHRTGNLLRVCDLLAAMSLEALQGSSKPFDARIHEIRPHPGQIRVARNIRALLQDSEILESHRNCGKVQDPYCLRCVPQVHGASRDALAHASEVFERELNSVTDNPLVFSNGDILSGGNFHGQPLALTMDYAAIALAELASISERRTYLLLAGHDGLPELLMNDTGVNSGFMIPQYTAAALVSENKVLAHPASVDSIPTSLGQEDHVSMGATSAFKLYQIMENVEHVLAVELLTATQALDFRKPLKPGTGVEVAHSRVRDGIAHVEADYEVRHDLASCRALVSGPELIQAVAEAGVELH